MSSKQTAKINQLTGLKSDGEAVAIRKMIRNDPGTAAVISKLTEGRSKVNFTEKGEFKIETPSMRSLRERSYQLVQNQEDAENILSVMPDVEMMASLLISSIISPHDLITKEVVIGSEFNLIESSLLNELLGRVRDYFNNDYKIKYEIQTILENILIHDGSHPLVVLPENAIDELINGRSNFSQESLYEVGLFNRDNTLKPLGLLNSPVNEEKKKASISLEGISDFKPSNTYNVESLITVNVENEKVSLGISVVDNYNLLRLPLLKEAKQELYTQSIIENNSSRNFFSLENFSEEGFDTLFNNNLSDRSIRSLIYKSRHETRDTVRVVKTQSQLKRKTIGEPLILKLPAESFIPVFLPGQEERQVGAFVLLDDNGNFLTKDNLSDFNSAFGANQRANNSFVSTLLRRVKNNYTGNFDCNNAVDQQELLDAYINIVEADFIARLRNSSYSNNLRISTNQELYKIMLIRHLQGNLTQALWLPKELFTYFAFSYNNVGMGRSILDRIKVLSSLRAIVMMSNVKASIRNSIGETIVNVTLDERDPDPVKTQEVILDMLMRTRQESMPIGVQNPADITEWLAKAGFRISWEGNPGLPNVRIESSQEALDYPKPDTDLVEYLEKVIAKAFGLTPEQIDNIHQPDHATTIVANNILFAKRVINYQDLFNPLLTDHCQKIIRFSENLHGSIVSIIDKNFNSIELTDDLKERAKEYPKARIMLVNMVANDFLESVKFELPKPKNVRIQNQIEELDRISELADRVTEAYFNDSVFSASVVGEFGAEAVNDLRERVKSWLLRTQLAESGTMSEIATLFSDDFNESEFLNMFEEETKITQTSIASLVKYLADTKEFRDKTTKASDIMGVEEDSFGGGGGDYGSGSSDDSEGGGGDDFGFGDDDFGFGGDAGDGDGDEADEGEFNF